MAGGVLNDIIWAAHDPQSLPTAGTANRLSSALVSKEQTTRQMYMRRYRTLIEDLLQAPGTPASELKFEKRVDELTARIRDDVLLDRARWPTYGIPQDLDTAVSIMKTEFFEPRRTHLFVTHGGPGKLIPPAPTGVAPITIAAIERATTTGNTEEQFIRLDNPTSDYVDISGWALLGEAWHIFRPGTVIPANGSIYVSPDVKAFRARSVAPTGGSGLFVQGNFKGTLVATPRALQLRSNTGALIAHTGYGIEDALLALRVAAGLSAPEPADLLLLDFVSDGESEPSVDLADAVRLMQLTAGAEPQ